MVCLEPLISAVRDVVSDSPELLLGLIKRMEAQTYGVLFGSAGLRVVLWKVDFILPIFKLLQEQTESSETLTWKWLFL